MLGWMVSMSRICAGNVFAALSLLFPCYVLFHFFFVFHESVLESNFGESCFSWLPSPFLFPRSAFPSHLVDHIILDGRPRAEIGI